MKNSGNEPVNADDSCEDHRCIGWHWAHTGSLYRNWNDRNVPNVNWNDGKLNVNWYNPGNANDNLRSREAVVQKPRNAGLLVIVYPDSVSSR